MRELRQICHTKTILPTSYTFKSSQILHIRRDPIVSGGFGDVYEGVLNGSKIYVKRVRIHSQGGPANPKKCFPVAFPSLLLPMRSGDSLPRGCGVETLETPKYCPRPWKHFGFSPACFRIDAWWRPDGTRQETPRC